MDSIARIEMQEVGLALKYRLKRDLEKAADYFKISQ